MASQETLALIPYCVLEHFYLKSHRAMFGEEQETLCKLFKPINGVITDLWYAHEGAPCAQRHLWDQEKIFAAAT